jgi:peptidyl-prolyl cis-trans isomerase D
MRNLTWSQFLKTEKAELIKAKMTGSSMEAIAKSAGSTVLQATDVIMENPMLTGVGLEATRLLELHLLGSNRKMSAPIEEYRVYVVVKKRKHNGKQKALRTFPCG